MELCFLVNTLILLRSFFNNWGSKYLVYLKFSDIIFELFKGILLVEL